MLAVLLVSLGITVRSVVVLVDLPVLVLVLVEVVPVCCYSQTRRLCDN